VENHLRHFFWSSTPRVETDGNWLEYSMNVQNDPQEDVLPDHFTGVAKIQVDRLAACYQKEAPC
jgi:hypothetical protein